MSSPDENKDESSSSIPDTNDNATTVKLVNERQCCKIVKTSTPNKNNRKRKLNKRTSIKEKNPSKKKRIKVENDEDQNQISITIFPRSSKNEIDEDEDENSENKEEINNLGQRKSSTTLLATNIVQNVSEEHYDQGSGKGGQSSKTTIVSNIIENDNKEWNDNQEEEAVDEENESQMTKVTKTMIRNEICQSEVDDDEDEDNAAAAEEDEEEDEDNMEVEYDSPNRENQSILENRSTSTITENESEINPSESGTFDCNLTESQLSEINENDENKGGWFQRFLGYMNPFGSSNTTKNRIHVIRKEEYECKEIITKKKN